MAAQRPKDRHKGAHYNPRQDDDEDHQVESEEEDEEEEEHEDYDDRKVKGGETSRVKLKDAELQEYSDLLAQQMAEGKLREALKRRDPDLLQLAVDQYEELGLRTTELYSRARDVLEDVINYRKLLRDARRLTRPDPQLLQDRMTAVKRNHLEFYLRDEMEKTRQLLQKLNVKERKSQILAMDKKTMAEMKSYSKPSPLVHRVMTSALLLLGEDEETTARWSKVQSLCNPDGGEGMVKRMMNFDPRDVDPEIAKRVRFLLKYITLADAQKASPGAGTFYVWSKRVIGDDPQDHESESGYSEQRDSRRGQSEDDDRYVRRRTDDDDDDDVASAVSDEESKYERRLREEDERKKYDEYYRRTLQNWIIKEKKIFAEQKGQRRAQAAASRPPPSQQQRHKPRSPTEQQGYDSRPPARPRQSQASSNLIHL